MNKLCFCSQQAEFDNGLRLCLFISFGVLCINLDPESVSVLKSLSFLLILIYFDLAFVLFPVGLSAPCQSDVFHGVSQLGVSIVNGLPARVCKQSRKYYLNPFITSDDTYNLISPLFRRSQKIKAKV